MQEQAEDAAPRRRRGRGRKRRTLDPLTTIGDVMHAAAEAAEDGPARSPRAGLLTRLTYRTCYCVTFGVVFSLMQLVRVVPTNNALGGGLRDGARAANDRVASLRSTERREGTSAAPV